MQSGVRPVPGRPTLRPAAWVALAPVGRQMSWMKARMQCVSRLRWHAVTLDCERSMRTVARNFVGSQNSCKNDPWQTNDICSDSAIAALKVRKMYANPLSDHPKKYGK